MRLNGERQVSAAEHARQRAAAGQSDGAVWRREAEVWFDGSIESVDRRLAMCDRLLASARQAMGEDGFTAGRLAAVDDLGRQREALDGLRCQLLTAGADIEAPTEVLPEGKLSHRDLRWVALEAPKFFRANHSAVADELRTRAKNYAELHTSRISEQRSRTVTSAFVHKVSQLHSEASRAPRTASVDRPAPDCADEMMFM